MKISADDLRVISWQSTNKNDCGPKCLQLIADFYNKPYKLDYLSNISETTTEGSSLYGLSKAATEMGLINVAAKVNFRRINKSLLPCILYMNNKHFIVLDDICNDHIFISDPGLGNVVYTKSDFLKKWSISDAEPEEGYALFLKPADIL